MSYEISPGNVSEEINNFTKGLFDIAIVTPNENCQERYTYLGLINKSK